VLHSEVRATVDYTWLGKLENELRQREVRMGETEFADRVTLRCWPVASDIDPFVAWLTDITSGQAKIERGETFYLDHDDSQ
jgi:putative IMPACT (imprinted ancient) family translation regulator